MKTPLAIQKNSAHKGHSNSSLFFQRKSNNENSAKAADGNSSFFEATSHFSTPPIIQPKLAIGQPNDKYEQEADSMADKVVQLPENKIQRACADCEKEKSIQTKPETESAKEKENGVVMAKPLQMKSQGGPSTASPALTSQLNNSKGGGSPLPTPTNKFMSNAFESDFSEVRVHTGNTAIQMSQDLNARAFTHGSDVYFNQGEYQPNSNSGKKLLAHELTHVVQQTGAKNRVQSKSKTSSDKLRVSNTADSNSIQRAGDPLAIPGGIGCPTDTTAGAAAGVGISFGQNDFAIDPTDTAQLTTFRNNWFASGGIDSIRIHGYASTEGDDGPNWTLSCNRARAVRTELNRLGIPFFYLSTVAHGESTDFGAGNPPNRRVVVSSTPGGGIIPFPIITLGQLTPNDNFTGRTTTRFGVGEVIALDFLSLPTVPPDHFGGLEWHISGGGGALSAVTQLGTATYTAPPRAAPVVTLQLRVATGALAGRVITSNILAVVEPSAVNFTATTFPNVSPLGGSIPVGTWGAGMLANVFVDPKDVSFQGVVFGEGTVPIVTSGYLTRFTTAHAANTFGPGGAGNLATGTPVSPPRDRAAAQAAPASTVLGVPICGEGDFLWAIPWEFSVSGGPRAPFTGGFTANQHFTSTFFCNGTVEKAGAGPFCRTINGGAC